MQHHANGVQDGIQQKQLIVEINMATNQTTVTVSRDTTYSLPISYSSLTMVTGVDQQEQLLLFRNDIETIYGSSLSLREYRGLGQIASDWLVLDEINRNITAINIPANATFVLDSGTAVAVPALQAGESITVKRVNIVSEPYVTWTAGSKITADQLNLNTSHLLGLIQEAKNDISNAILRTDSDSVVNPLEGNIDANGFKVTNLATPTANTDAATKAYVDAAIQTAVTSKLGVANGIATLDAVGILQTSQRFLQLGVLPRSFFAQGTAPVRTTAGQGLYGWGSLWYNTTNGRLFVYIADDRYAGATETQEGDIGYWVDVSAPAQ
jgi:hypothetical protein